MKISIQKPKLSIITKILRETKKKIQKLQPAQLYAVVAISGMIFGLGSGVFAASLRGAKQLEIAGDTSRALVKSDKSEAEKEIKTETKTETTIKQDATQSNQIQQAPAQATSAPQPVAAPRPAVKKPIAKAPASGTTVVSPSAQDIVENEIFRLVNQERAALGLAPLVHDSKLRQAAGIRAQEEAIISFVGVDHTRPDGRSFGTVLPQVGYTGYTAAGENLAWGYKSQFDFNNTKLKALALKIFTDWKNSPGHYAQIKNANYNQTGVGVVLINQNNRTYYFGIQLFARR